MFSESQGDCVICRTFESFVLRVKKLVDDLTTFGYNELLKNSLLYCFICLE